MHSPGCGGSAKEDGQVPGAMAASLVVNDSDDLLSLFAFSMQISS